MKTLFPRPTAWLAALALLVFAGALATVSTHLFAAGFSLMETPRIAAFLGFLGVISPILLVAFFNHGMHVVLDRFAKRVTPRGFVPGLMSWWMGLFAWSVFALASSTSALIALMIHPGWGVDSLFGMFQTDASLASILSVPTFVWLGVAALLFQVERTVRERMAAGPDSTH